VHPGEIGASYALKGLI
jgi:hypothetical protein